MKKFILIFGFAATIGAFFHLFHPAYSRESKVEFLQAPSDPASIARGKEVYEKKCQWCHGVKGDGKGAAASRVNPLPRDFTRGEFKFRSTQSGELPTDWDLYRTIARGLTGTTMYGWEKAIPEKDRWALTAYLKTFSGRFQSESYTKDKVLIKPYAGNPGKVSPDLMQEGDKLFHDESGAKCFQCHGEHGRGNGTSADSLTDDWNHKIWPTDLTKGYTYRGGSSVEDIYRDISTGLTGSPMPSYQGALDADPKKDERKRWALAYYVKSLQVPRNPGTLIKAVKIQGELPLDPDDPRWNSIPWIDIPMAGQILQEPREFTPSIDNLSLQASYNEKEVAFLVEWNDRTKDPPSPASANASARFRRDIPPSPASAKRYGGASAGLKKKFPDAVAFQFPVAVPEDPAQSPKPYFLAGSEKQPVDLWNWEADRPGILEFNASGMNQVIPVPVPDFSMPVAGKSVYQDGKWRVVLVRPLRTGSSRQIQFSIGKFIPVAFSVWDGGNGEHGARRAISSWYYLLLIPPLPGKIYVVPVLSFFAGILLLWWLEKTLKNYSK